MGLSPRGARVVDGNALGRSLPFAHAVSTSYGNGRPATTHWSALDRLAESGNDIRVDADARFVDDGNVVTAAGVSAGIDMALHLVARLESVDAAKSVRRYIQYDPQPPV